MNSENCVDNVKQKLVFLVVLSKWGNLNLKSSYDISVLLFK